MKILRLCCVMAMLFSGMVMSSSNTGRITDQPQSVDLPGVGTASITELSGVIIVSFVSNSNPLTEVDVRVFTSVDLNSAYGVVQFPNGFTYLCIGSPFLESVRVRALDFPQDLLSLPPITILRQDYTAPFTVRSVSQIRRSSFFSSLIINYSTAISRTIFTSNFPSTIELNNNLQVFDVSPQTFTIPELGVATVTQKDLNTGFEVKFISDDNRFIEYTVNVPIVRSKRAAFGVVQFPEDGKHYLLVAQPIGSLSTSAVKVTALDFTQDLSQSINPLTQEYTTFGTVQSISQIFRNDQAQIEVNLRIFGDTTLTFDDYPSIQGSALDTTVNCLGQPGQPCTKHQDCCSGNCGFHRTENPDPNGCAAFIYERACR